MPQIPLIKPKPTGLPNFRKFIIRWNNQYPWDYLWRKKYSVPFGSPAHLAVSFPAMKFDLREDQIYGNEITRQRNRNRANLLPPPEPHLLLVPSKETKVSLEITDSEYNDLDLSQFNDISTT